MTTNIFTVETQEELTAILHRPKTVCEGDCDWCSKFHRAAKPVKALANEKGIIITLFRNKEVRVSRGYFHAWCEECSDGVNHSFWEAADWAQRHAVQRHGIK